MSKAVLCRRGQKEGRFMFSVSATAQATAQPATVFYMLVPFGGLYYRWRKATYLVTVALKALVCGILHSIMLSGWFFPVHSTYNRFLQRYVWRYSFGICVSVLWFLTVYGNLGIKED